MELVEGTDTGGANCIGTDRNRRSPARRSVRFAEALEAAHEKGIIHRDLKPPNVKVTPEGKVKVLDLGQQTSVSSQRKRKTGSLQCSRTTPKLLKCFMSYRKA